MASLLISIGALLVSVIALVWQFISWLRTGPVIQVRTHYAIPVIGGEMSTEEFLAVSATNRGRSPATITSWGLLLPGGATTAADSAPLPGVEALPFRIDPYAETSWYIANHEVERICHVRGCRRSDIRPFVIVSGQGRKTGKRLT
ncbi:hypothetical protein [Streptomyces bullii]|uniref:Uncharacterized protein n=1 Tax=Streptomyces bullii TaxID=349910 RepID=A0ABW0UJ82_9ACTN